jgi:murein endopeptidase
VRNTAAIAALVATVALIEGCSTTAPRARRPFPVPTGGSNLSLEEVMGLSENRPEGDDVRSMRLQTATGELKTLYWLKRSATYGSPSNGSLSGARAIPAEGPGWIHRGKRPYGTDETILLLTWAITEVGRNFPGTTRIVIGDISDEAGGKAPPHKSHRSGRDVDIGFYAADNEPIKWFERLPVEQIDAEKTWFLLERLLMTGQVRYVFVDYTIQQALYEAALDAGWSDDDLAPVFEYPRGRGGGRAVVRHVAGHANHLHIRFACPADDEDCVP